MNPPANIDMNLIREAMLRRQQGQLGGGAGAPAAGQLTQPGGVLPGGGVNVPGTPPPPMPPVGGGGMPQAAPGAAPGQPGGKPRTNPDLANFDEDTKLSAKALMQQLLKYL